MKKVLVLIVLLGSCFSVQTLSAEKMYTGAEVYSNDSVRFGKFEIRMKMVSAKGVVSSFFLYDNISWKGRPYPWREIDIESIGINKNTMQTNIITGYQDKRVTSENINVVKDIDTSYHTYAIEWTPDYVAWLVDGKIVRKDTASESQQVIDLRDKNQTYRINVWIAEWEEWVGAFDKSVLPLYQYVNWVKYYKYTPGKGQNDFTHEWTDDFDTFDTKRWGRGEWSFDGNLVQFNSANAVIKDGYLIMCLTDKDAKGFSGKVSKDK